MPIPEFRNHILPPYIGDLSQPDVVLSPYDCGVEEFCQRFGDTIERQELIIGFLTVRQYLYEMGIMHGYQWVSGSFVEDVEKIRKKPPGDIDVVTFFYGFSKYREDYFKLIFGDDGKIFFRIHNFQMHYGPDGSIPNSHFPAIGSFLSRLSAVELTKYWTQFFSHQRESNTWKGMIRIIFTENGQQEEQKLLMKFIESRRLP